jgi:hypothetical protein
VWWHWNPQQERNWILVVLAVVSAKLMNGQRLQEGYGSHLVQILPKSTKHILFDNNINK